MEKPIEALKIFSKYTKSVDDEIRKLLESQEDLLMYDMMRYFFGSKNEKLEEQELYGGKRFRSGLCMIIAEFYGKAKEALEVATSIEIFHNFTLIHDDVEDNDPMRRGKPSVWKLWGRNHAINTGDTQLVLSSIELTKAVKKAPEKMVKVQEFLYEVYKKVAEGQFLDFTLGELSVEDDFVSEENYMRMIEGKSAILVGASAKVAGMVAGVKAEEAESLWQMGLNLGLAYQLNDDLLSIWGLAEKTGKIEAKDIEEKKKTLPIIYLFQSLDKGDRVRFSKIYSKEGGLNHDDISEIKSLLSENKAHDYVWSKIEGCFENINKAIASLSIAKENKELLLGASRALIPDMKWWDA